MKHFIIILAAFGLLSGVASADPITYTETTKATGTLGGTPFTNALVTLTLIGNTSNVGFGPAPFNAVLVNPGTATIDIAGLGTASFTDLVEILSSFNDPSPPDFGQPGVLIATLDNPAGTSITGLVVDLNPAFLGYDLRTSFGPISGTGGTASGLGGVHHTTLGDLFFNPVGSGQGATFTATATPIPEPASITLLLSGALLLGSTSLRSRRKRM